MDRRWIFLMMAVAVAVPLLAGLRFPEEPTPLVTDVFNTIDSLPEGSTVVMAFDYDPGSQGELHPMAAGFTRQCALKKHKMIFMTLWPAGPAMIQSHIDMLKREFPQYEYGRDYVNLGFFPGYESPIVLMGTNLPKAAPADVNGTGLSRLPLTANLKSLQDTQLIAEVSAGYPGAKEWVQYAATRHQIPMICGTTGVQVSTIMPYVPGQVRGLLAAIKGAAEYEQLLLERYPPLRESAAAQEALRRMGPQLIAHLLIVSLIVFGNILYFLDKRRAR